WEQKAILFPSDLATQSYFGYSVAVSGSYTIVGASNGRGTAYIFERNAGTGAWEQKATWTNPDATPANFGYSVAIDGTYAAVGARGKMVNAIVSAGGIYVFERITGTWIQTAIIDNPDPVASDYFGSSVSVNGVFAVVGCYNKDPASKVNAGSSYLYKRNSSTGQREQKTQWTASDGLAGDQLGISVGISGTVAIMMAGAYNKAVMGVAGAGGVYVYDVTD
ncbi:hypothetical protein JKP88DRAFT_155436, partial [Tribonema minus]